MAASSSSSQVPCGKYDVFISFRGPDVRFGFVHHLKTALSQKLIDVYVDDRLEGGDEISPTLMKAIERSKIALVIFSKDYASSRWCLEELVKIMECKEAGKQIVIPVFYLVDPSDVRHQNHTYAKAFTRHKEKFKVSEDNLRNWRSVLKQSANLSGHPSSAFPNESELIVAIVEDVLKKLKEKKPIVPNPDLFVPNSQIIIGSHQNVTIIESLMEIKSQEVRFVGIWGMGGIGKTTLARAIFGKFCSEFARYYFLENVREKSKVNNGFNSLRKELLSKLGQNDHKNNTPEKVLIALDDVDNPKHLKDLVGLLQFGPGSRVIVTSRKKDVLRSGGINDQFIHGVDELSSEESLELFSIHAFNQSRPKEEYEKLSQKTLDIAKGVPLALEVLGSHFHSRDKAYWESELIKLKRYPHEEIQNILRISYDGLDCVDKEMFLDIAFFLVGCYKDMVTSLLEACGFKAVSGIQNLIDKALIKSKGFGRILMHDLIREMAEQIVREESMRHPQRRSRLKDADDIYNILKSNEGTDEIECIGLDMDLIDKYIKVEADIFGKMKKLRLLFLLRYAREPNIDFPSDLHPFSNELRFLWWDSYPLETLPSGSYLENLVVIHMERSNVKRLWDGKQDLGNLKTINFSCSYQLIELPDLSMAHKLESVELQCCISLRSIHPSILSLPSIIKLEVSNCSKLESIESETHLESFFDLRANDCCLKKLSFSSKKLRVLNLGNTKVEMLHFPINRCTELTCIAIEDGRVGSVSIDELCCLTNLEVFAVTNLKKVIDIKQLHSLFDAWRNLGELRLEGSFLSEIPDNIKALTSLTYISLRSCKRLKSILGLPPFLQHLDASECASLETVSSDSLVRNKCVFNFCNCEKLDERSLRYIRELILSSMTSASGSYDDDEITCYPGSRVPEWMEYKPMIEAFNATEFTCNLERSHDLLICCVAPPHPISHHLKEVHCYFSYDDNKKFHTSHALSYPTLYWDHVLLWRVMMWFSSGIDNDAKIACELFLEYWDEVERASYKVPAKACGVHLLHCLEPGRSRKRVADIRVENQLPCTKQLKTFGVSHVDNFICHPLQLKFLRISKQKDLSLIHFL
ncbi:hypothetical protein QN277_022780 [Acacia crassicarpa]|uniref:TIR domain-containing protein n=1 Tax=Acacia crassicarpa TaxID=499986 RepID=A0AAE1MMB5_9FABA|nr:hypothetical protein QN277_022780 [Acacia crassicarpa]